MLRNDDQSVAMKYCDFWYASLYIFHWRKQVLTNEFTLFFRDTEFSVGGKLSLKLAAYWQFIGRMPSQLLGGAWWMTMPQYLSLQDDFVTHSLLLKYKFLLKS